MCIIFQLILVCYMYGIGSILIYIHPEHGRQGWVVCVWRRGAVGGGGGGKEAEAVLRV